MSSPHRVPADSGDRDEFTRRLDHDRANLLHRQTPTVLLILALSALGMLLAIQSRQPLDTAHWVWFAAMLVLIAFRFGELFAWRHAASAQRDPDYWLRAHAIGTLASAITWAVFPLLFLGALVPSARTIVLIVYVALAGGAASALAASRPLATAYAIVVVGAPSLMLLLIGDRAEVILGLLGLAYLTMLVGAIRMVNGSIVRALELAWSNESLMQRALEQQHETEALNLQLAGARDELQRINEDLEGKVQQRTERLERQISERRAFQRQLEALANTDPLTGLANRGKLARELDEALAEARADSTSLAVLFVDLDRFKEINDGMGHPVGDRVLRTVAQRLRAAAPDAQCIARWGGDEFVVIQLGAAARPDRLIEGGNQLVAALSEPIDIGSGQVRIGASIGVAVFPDHADDADALIKQADVAVYEAKLEGRGVTLLYRHEWGERARRRHELGLALREAIERDGLELLVQPIVSIPGRQLVGVEAHPRWTHPEFGAFDAQSMVQLAEESGLIGALGAWILGRACEAGVRLSRPHPIRMSVNVPVQQMLVADFVASIDQALARSAMPPGLLEIGVSEQVFAEDLGQIVDTLTALKSRGVALSIDDFGSGYSSLAHLQRLRANTLRVAPRFVRDLDGGGDAIIGAIISIARNLGIVAVVEGVDTESQLRRVLELGAVRAQGELFDPPRPLEQLLADLAADGPADPGRWHLASPGRPPVHDPR